METTPVIKILVLLNGNEFNGRLLGSDGFERAEFPIFSKISSGLDQCQWYQSPIDNFSHTSMVNQKGYNNSVLLEAC